MATDIEKMVLDSHPEELGGLSSLDHAEHVENLALKGYPQTAADHLLNAEMTGHLAETVGNVIRRLNLKFTDSHTDSGEPEDQYTSKVLSRARAYETLIELGLNLTGIEPKIIGLSRAECDDSYDYVQEALKSWEAQEADEFSGEHPISSAVVKKLLADMRKIMKGAGMMAKIADEIEPKVDWSSPCSSYLEEASKAFRDNVYYKISQRGLCKLGNDYAMGLRWLRHLGYVQVSTNPVLAAKAYDDEPSLWDDFKEKVKEHPNWLKDPEQFGDDIAMEATMTALWPNLAVFRPLALASGLHHGVVSYQLNPNVAHSYDGSVADAMRIYHAATEFFRTYDEALAWGYSNTVERSRPNIVFKVAGGYPAALDITEKLDSLGIGTNNTVTYTVSQEASLIIRAISGMAKAVKMGIPVTQAYETNMGGRLESHLRDVEAERILRDALAKAKDPDKLLEELAGGLGIEAASNMSREEKISSICSYKYLKSLKNPAFVQAISQTGAFGSPEETEKYLSDLESDIGFSGTLVCQRVYWIFFSDENKPKWKRWLQKKFELTDEQAADVMDKIDMLPASKRKPNDTYLTLASKNMTNTEFPNHQYNVLLRSREKDFDLLAYRDAITMDHDPEIARRLLRLEDFKRAYELTPELVDQLKEAGVEADFGTGGLKVEDWPNFGSVVKTTTEFKNAYEDFKKRTVEFVKRVSKE